MNGLWIILLDTSGSMGGPFTGTLRFTGDIEYGPQTSKIEAAKKRLIREISGLSSVDIIIIAFASSACVVVREPSDNVRRIAEQIKHIRADGPSTNIAAALALAAQEAKNIAASPKTIMLISDGLSNEGDPVGASRECREVGLVINAILIDPTDEGEAIARTISVGGWVRAVGSEAQAGKAMAEASAPYLGAPVPAAQQSPFPKIITVIAACIGVFGTAAGLASSGLDKPSLFPWAAGIVLLAACPLLVYVCAARETGQPLFKSPTESYEPRYYKYGTLKRVLAWAGLIVLLGLASMAFSSGWQRRRIIQIRVANETDSTVHDAELVFGKHQNERFYPDGRTLPPEAENLRSYFGTIKPHEATPYNHFNQVDTMPSEESDSQGGTLIELHSDMDGRYYVSVPNERNRVVWRAFLDLKYTCVMRSTPEVDATTVESHSFRTEAERHPPQPIGTFLLSCSRDGGY